MDSNNIHKLDQSTEDMKQLAQATATIASTYYQTLFNKGVPGALAAEMTLQYNEALIELMMYGRNRDKE